jgi:hypothetical protein
MQEDINPEIELIIYTPETKEEPPDNRPLPDNGAWTPAESPLPPLPFATAARLARILGDIARNSQYPQNAPSADDAA